MMPAGFNSKTILIAFVTLMYITGMWKLNTNLTSLYIDCDDLMVRPAKSTGLSDDEEVVLDTFKLHTSCSEDPNEARKYNSTVSEMAKLFQVKQGSWKLTHNSRSGALSLRFQIIECPQRYAASTFHVQARTSNTVFAGSVGHRYKVEEGCGYYNATVPIVPPEAQNSRIKSIRCHNSTIDSPSLIIEAFWTTEYRNYANRLEDMKKALLLYETKNENMTTDYIAELLGPDRLSYLRHNLDVLPSFPIGLELPDNILGSFTLKPEEMPNCSEVPIQDWLPVGIVNKYGPQGNHLLHFQSHKCNYRYLNRQELQYWFAGMRVKYMGDSHCENESKYVFQLTCPEANTTSIFYEDKYRCSMPSEDASQSRNSFAFAYRFYRGIIHETGGDHDGISTSMRQATKIVCTKFFGIGLYNATVVTTPSWIFVYETSEGLYDYLHSLKNSIEYCRRVYPEEMDKLILLIQSPIASDVTLPQLAKPVELNWRQYHNFRQEAFTQAMYSELGGLVDGIIPSFQWTLARNWMNNTFDGMHMEESYYEEPFHVQTMAIISAMRSKGWRVPIVSANDDQARWFDGIPLE
jgi:hypothetical protein